MPFNARSKFTPSEQSTISEILILVRVELLIPYSRYDVAALIRREGRILEEAHEEQGTRITAMLDQEGVWRVKRQLDAGADRPQAKGDEV